MENKPTPWSVGQIAVINRQTVVTIEKVTPSGRVVAGGRTFDAGGIERKAGRDWCNRARLEPLTPEIQAEMELLRRAVKSSRDADRVIREVDTWLRKRFSLFGRREIPDITDVEKAERLVAAIREVMGDELP